MDNDTLLVVTSDHGLTSHGSHGGMSPLETESFLFGYHKRGFRKEVYDPRYASIMSPRTGKMMRMTNWAVTMSMLTGAAPPFASLGHIINNFYLKPSPRSGDDGSHGRKPREQAPQPAKTYQRSLEKGSIRAQKIKEALRNRKLAENHTF